jgi:hypothetical protein
MSVESLVVALPALLGPLAPFVGPLTNDAATAVASDAAMIAVKAAMMIFAATTPQICVPVFFTDGPVAFERPIAPVQTNDYMATASKYASYLHSFVSSSDSDGAMQHPFGMHEGLRSASIDLKLARAELVKCAHTTVQSVNHVNDLIATPYNGGSSARRSLQSQITETHAQGVRTLADYTDRLTLNVAAKQNAIAALLDVIINSCASNQDTAMKDARRIVQSVTKTTSATGSIATKLTFADSFWRDQAVDIVGDLFAHDLDASARAVYPGVLRNGDWAEITPLAVTSAYESTVTSMLENALAAINEHVRISKELPLVVDSIDHVADRFSPIGWVFIVRHMVRFNIIWGTMSDVDIMQLATLCSVATKAGKPALSILISETTMMQRTYSDAAPNGALTRATANADLSRASRDDAYAFASQQRLAENEFTRNGTSTPTAISISIKPNPTRLSAFRELQEADATLQFQEKTVRLNSGIPENAELQFMPIADTTKNAVNYESTLFALTNAFADVHSIRKHLSANSTGRTDNDKSAQYMRTLWDMYEPNSVVARMHVVAHMARSIMHPVWMRFDKAQPSRASTSEMARISDMIGRIQEQDARYTKRHGKMSKRKSAKSGKNLMAMRICEIVNEIDDKGMSWDKYVLKTCTKKMSDFLSNTMTMANSLTEYIPVKIASSMNFVRRYGDSLSSNVVDVYASTGAKAIVTDISERTGIPESSVLMNAVVMSVPLIGAPIVLAGVLRAPRSKKRASVANGLEDDAVYVLIAAALMAKPSINWLSRKSAIMSYGQN